MSSTNFLPAVNANPENLPDGFYRTRHKHGSKNSIRWVEFHGNRVYLGGHSWHKTIFFEVNELLDSRPIARIVREFRFHSVSAVST